MYLPCFGTGVKTQGSRPVVVELAARKVAAGCGRGAQGALNSAPHGALLVGTQRPRPPPGGRSCVAPRAPGASMPLPGRAALVRAAWEAFVSLGS
jgi:hypothetical protein